MLFVRGFGEGILLGGLVVGNVDRLGRRGVGFVWSF